MILSHKYGLVSSVDFTDHISCSCTVQALFISLLTICGLVIRNSGYRSRGPGFDSRSYQVFWEVGAQERDALSLVRTIEELIEWKSSGSYLGNRINGRGNALRWPRNTLYPQKLALTSPTNGGRSVGIVCLRTTATQFGFQFCLRMILSSKIRR
jgi:hypothetical protein